MDATTFENLPLYATFNFVDGGKTVWIKINGHQCSGGKQTMVFIPPGAQVVPVEHFTVDDWDGWPWQVCTAQVATKISGDERVAQDIRRSALEMATAKQTNGPVVTRYTLTDWAFDHHKQRTRKVVWCLVKDVKTKVEF